MVAGVELTVFLKQAEKEKNCGSYSVSCLSEESLDSVLLYKNKVHSVAAVDRMWHYACAGCVILLTEQLVHQKVVLERSCILLTSLSQEEAKAWCNFMQAVQQEEERKTDISVLVLLTTIS